MNLNNTSKTTNCITAVAIMHNQDAASTATMWYAPTYCDGYSKTMLRHGDCFLGASPQPHSTITVALLVQGQQPPMRGQGSIWCGGTNSRALLGWHLSCLLRMVIALRQPRCSALGSPNSFDSRQLWSHHLNTTIDTPSLHGTCHTILAQRLLHRLNKEMMHHLSTANAATY